MAWPLLNELVALTGHTNTIFTCLQQTNHVRLEPEQLALHMKLLPLCYLPPSTTNLEKVTYLILYIWNPGIGSKAYCECSAKLTVSVSYKTCICTVKVINAVQLFVVIVNYAVDLLAESFHTSEVYKRKQILSAIHCGLYLHTW